MPACDKGPHPARWRIAEAMNDLNPGASVGRYRLIARMASGGMAEVWRARGEDDRAAPDVVLKLMLPALAAEAAFVAMFDEEVRLAAAVTHPNVVRLLAHGTWSGRRFLVLERIEGWTLRELIERSRELRRLVPPWLACYVAAECCVALECAHAAVDDSGTALGIVHRDVTPENVMVSEAGVTKLLDFGLARAARTVSSLRPGVLAGKVAYLAPEQISSSLDGSEPDHRADVYSLGVVLYELVAGQLPFTAENDVALLRAILGGAAPRPLREAAPWAPAGLGRVLDGALERDRRCRFQAAVALREAVEAHLQEVGQFPTRRHVAAHLASLFAPRRRRGAPRTLAMAWRTEGQETAELSSSTEVTHGSRTAEG